MIGGYAVMLYTEPRYTKDIDIAVGGDDEEIDRAVDALKEFGFPLTDDQRARFHAADAMILLGRPPNRIDILNSIPGVNFSEAFQRRNEIVVDGSSIFFISLEDLIATKTITKRPQDLLDLKKLRRASRKLPPS